MIEFVEGKPQIVESLHGPRELAPVYMQKDGAEYFVVNRVVYDSDRAWGKYEVDRSQREVEDIKAFLTKTDGAYFKFHGDYDDPLGMLESIFECGYTFTDDDHFIECANDGFTDFHGNLNEISAAFHYRIYNAALLDKIKATIRKG